MYQYNEGKHIRAKPSMRSLSKIIPFKYIQIQENPIQKDEISFT